MQHDNSEEKIDVQQLTSFHENATTVGNQIRDVMPYTETLTQLVDSNDVTDFLGRPHIIATGDFSASNLQNAVLASGDICDYLNSVSMWYRKIAGYRMIRGKANLKLQINGNPFQQGRLLLHFLPIAQNYASYNSVYVNSHNVNLCQKTQQPSVELDVQETTCELSIPYVAPTMFYDRTIDEFDWGTWYLSVLSPLLVGSSGQTSLEWTLFLYFTDVELSGPIYGPESGKSNAANARLASEKKKIVREGKISNLLDKISKASGIFDDVPMIGSVASSISTYSGMFADALSIFGWSKPNSDQTANIMTINPTRNFVNCDGENYGDVMALNHQGALPIVTGFAGTDVDEMSFAFLKKVSAYFTEFNWTTGQVTDVSLYSLKVGPKHIVQNGVTVNSGVTHYWRSAPPFAWLSKMFKYYRGGIRLTFKIVKTGFHSGRLLVQFNTKDQTLSNSQGSYVLREVVDIRSTNEFSIVIPYIRATNYIETDLTDVIGDEYSTLGTLQVRVLNELRAPETCSQSVKVLVYASAADDFELAYPQNYRQYSFAAESGVAGDMKMVDKPMGNANHERSDIINNNMTIGDPFTSIKQLLMSYRKIYFGVSNDTSAPYNFSIWPFGLGCYYNYPNITSVSNHFGDYISDLSTGYALSRGSMRYCIPANTNSYVSGAYLQNNNTNVPLTSTVVANVSDEPPSFADSYFTNIWDEWRCGQMNIKRNAQWGTEITVPHYGQTPSRLNRYGNEIPDDIDTNNCLLTFTFGTGEGTLGTNYNPIKNIYRSGGDDFCLGYFIGFAPYMYSYASE